MAGGDVVVAAAAAKLGERADHKNLALKKNASKA